MAEFKRSVITDKGRALAAKILTGENMLFSKVRSSDHEFQGEVDFEKITVIPSIKQEVDILSIDIVNNHTVDIYTSFNNEVLEEGYYFRVVGLYAIDPDDGEILYSISISDRPDYMPPNNGITMSAIDYQFVTAVSNSANVTLDVTPSSTVTKLEFDNLKERVVVVEGTISDLAGIGRTTETVKQNADDIANNKAEVDAQLAEKINKVEGKNLSTNDFTDSYKRQNDNYKPEASIFSGDMNELRETGRYSVSSNALNAPILGVGFFVDIYKHSLLVNDKHHVVQIAYKLTEPHIRFSRRQWGGVWSEWIKEDVVGFMVDKANELIAHEAESASKHINESGSNENGEYVKFDDGTMICLAKNRGSYTISSNNNGVHESDAISILFPAVFIDIPACGLPIPLGSTTLIWLAETVDSTKLRGRIGRVGLQGGLQTVTTRVLAMGRWKI